MKLSPRMLSWAVALAGLIFFAVPPDLTEAQSSSWCELPGWIYCYEWGYKCEGPHEPAQCTYMEYCPAQT